MIVQLYVPGTAFKTPFIQGRSAHSAVVLPGTFPLAHFGVVALKRVAMRLVGRKLDLKSRYNESDNRPW